MTALQLDLAIYPLKAINQGIAAYRDIANMALRCSEQHVATLEVASRCPHDDARVIDEFLNHLIALVVQNTPQEP